MIVEYVKQYFKVYFFSMYLGWVDILGELKFGYFVNKCKRGIVFQEGYDVIIIL